jgi:hypothetical protein
LGILTKRRTRASRSGFLPGDHPNQPRTFVCRASRASRRKIRSDSGTGRSENSLRTTNIEAKFDPEAFITSDCPDIACVVPTPGVSLEIVSSSSITAIVRSAEAESGSWMLTWR